MDHTMTDSLQPRCIRKRFDPIEESANGVVFSAAIPLLVEDIGSVRCRSREMRTAFHPQFQAAPEQNARIFLVSLAFK